MRPIRSLSILVLGLMSCAPAAMAATRCPATFAAGQPPALLAENLRPSTEEICYSAFALLHSGLTRTPLWSAEHLTASGVGRARSLEREDSFHPDPNLPPGVGAELSDYKRSGYDRGHMSPNGDMTDPVAQGESFSLANMIPQDPDNNRHLWADIESAVRNLAVSDGEVYVVTGPIFSGAKVMSLKGRVLIPTSIFKAVYDPSRGGAGAYVTPNAPGTAWQEVSLDQLRAMTGIDVFPALPAPLKASAMPLPAPRLRAYGAADHAPGEGRLASGGAARGIWNFIKKEW